MHALIDRYSLSTYYPPQSIFRDAVQSCELNKVLRGYMLLEENWLHLQVTSLSICGSPGFLIHDTVFSSLWHISHLSHCIWLSSVGQQKQLGEGKCLLIAPLLSIASHSIIYYVLFLFSCYSTWSTPVPIKTILIREQDIVAWRLIQRIVQVWPRPQLPTLKCWITYCLGKWKN